MKKLTTTFSNAHLHIKNRGVSKPFPATKLAVVGGTGGKPKKPTVLNMNSNIRY